jgi:hypothetical protein
MKDIDLVVGHSLLSNDDLFTAVDDEVATLVKLTVFTTVHSIILVQAVKLTELRAEHDWNLANHNSGRIELAENLFDLSLALASLLIDLILMTVQLLLR